MVNNQRLAADLMAQKLATMASWVRANTGGTAEGALVLFAEHGARYTGDIALQLMTMLDEAGFTVTRKRRK